MKAVIAQHHHIWRVGITAMTGKGTGIHQGGIGIVTALQLQRAIDNCQRRNIAPAASGEREGLIKESAHPGDHLAAAHRVITGTAGITVGRYGICAIKSIIQTAKAGIGGVQRITCIGNRHDKLRPGNAGDLGINRGGIDAEIRTFRDQIADLGQESRIGIGIDARSGIVTKPLVDLRLHPVAGGQQIAVARCQTMNRRIESGPEVVRRDIGAVKQPVIDEIGKFHSDRQVPAGDIVRHHSLQGVSQTVR